MLEDNTCTFTGHRAAKLPWKFNESDPRCEDLKERISEALDSAYEDGYRHFICGCADGGDIYFGEAVISLRDRHPDVSLEAAVPCRTQAELWAEGQRWRYYDFLEQCDSVTVLQETYTAGCMMKRNCYMVDHSSRVLAFFDGQKGGTLNTLRYALKKHRQIVNL